MTAKSSNHLDRVWRAVRKSEIEKLVKDLVRIESHPEVPTQEKAVAEHMNEFLVGE